MSLNTHFFTRTAVVLGLMISIILAAKPGHTEDHAAFKFYTVEADFADVKDDIENAIIDEGLKVDHTGNLAGMLDRTAAAVGATKKVYKGAMYISFCSAKLSRAAMEADPQNMVFCPYTMYLYETTKEPGKVKVGYRPLRWPGAEISNKALKDVENLLDKIARAATE